jgi:hypothetical protein
MIQGPATLLTPMPDGLLREQVQDSEEARGAVLLWRDRLLNVLEELGPNAKAGLSIRAEDRAIASQIHRFLRHRPKGMSTTERLEQGCVFWDVVRAALLVRANATVHVLCSNFKKEHAVGENLLGLVFKVDASEALPLLLDRGWEDAWRKNSHGWDGTAWKTLAVNCRRWMKQIKPDEVLCAASLFLDEGERPHEAFDHQWAALTESITLVNDASDVGPYTKKLHAFLDDVHPELAFMFKEHTAHEKIIGEACASLAWHLASEPRKYEPNFDLDARLDAAEQWWMALSTAGWAPVDTWDTVWRNVQNDLTQWQGGEYVEVMARWGARRERAWLLEKHPTLTDSHSMKAAL